MHKKILVIDDEEILTKTFTILLERNGYEVYTAKNSNDALVIYEEEEFDLIVCDIRMPGMNGVEIIKALHQSSSHPNKRTPVIFVTGYADEKVESEAKTLAPLAYIFKPFDNPQILDLIKGALSQ